MTGPTLRTPTRRTCEICGRTEKWDDAEASWRVTDADDETTVGSLYCIHEWDINGTFAPFEDDGAEA
ncbi:HEWD family protein [Halogeometricum limi]|uniref:HEWD domain-containing protein n=1 Tax=Halogeometricum limi TaxID=555875 RepID=A0A1I6GGG9_9EURY|nr:HEWD family protein [Halogeometricum limi]SFR41286.1 hypothetical protein SAMN04488124_1007 [Halogeometricum limi]